MNFSKTTFIKLPQVKNFSFFIGNIFLSDYKPVRFGFVDNESFSFSFFFESGLLTTDKIVYGYNNKEPINIKGSIKNGNLFYKINDDLYGEISGSFSKLDKFGVFVSGEPVNCDILLNSDPINYSLNFNKDYVIGNKLTGNFYSDTLFDIKNFSLTFLNSNADLLEKDGSSSFFLNNIIFSGNNYFTLNDIDVSKFEYDNPFITYADTTFNQLNLNKNSYRGGFYSQIVSQINEDLNNKNQYLQYLIEQKNENTLVIIGGLPDKQENSGVTVEEWK